MAQPFVPAQPVDPAVYSTNPAGNFMQGIDMIYQPMQMKNQMQMDALKKAQLQQQNKSQPQMDQAKLALLNAQTQKASQPAQPSGEFYQLSQYYNSLPPGSQKDMVKQRLDMLTSRGNGTTVYDPSTGNPLVELGGGGAAGNIKPKQGEGFFYKTDDQGNTVLDKTTGKPIALGTLTPYTEQERNELAGRSLMSDLQPIVNNAQSVYTGKGSIQRFTSDVNYVEKHPNEDSPQKRRLVDFKLSEKLLAPLTVKEQSTLGASQTLGAFRAIQPSLKSSDLPKFMKVYESFKVPGSVSKEAGDKFLKLLTESTSKANAEIPAFQKRYYNIEDQKSDQARALAKSANQSSKVADSNNQQNAQPTNSYSTNYSDYHPKDMMILDDGTKITAEEAKKKGLLK
jgi:hypothetical protein